MTDAKEFKNCFVNIEEQRICILMLHLFCSINYPLCTELILKHSITVIMLILYFQFDMLITFPNVVCRVFWAGGLSLHLYIE